jgi:hypothetical protein
MDYKFIILLLVIVGLIIFFTRELDNMKSEIGDKLDKIASYIDNSSNNTLTKMQNGFGMCVNKIKTLNGDYIEQVRKMNDYGNQPVTNMSNHYTDTDSQGKGMKFAALSDCRTITQTNFKTTNLATTSYPKNEQINEYYLSEDEHKNEDTDEFKLKLPESEKQQSEKQQSEKKNQHKQMNLSLDLIDDENNHITTESTSHSKKICDDKQDEDCVSIEESEHSSNYDSVSFGSKNQQKIINENDSVTTATIQKLTKNNLLPKEKYSFEVLKKIAKELSIPISHKEGNTRKQLRKDELYDKINECLMGNRENK